MTNLARVLTFAAVLASLAVGPGAGLAAAASLVVTDCGDSGAPTQLRALIAAAGPGDTIEVPACTITLTTAATPLIIRQDLTITGAGAARTIIDGGHVTGVFQIAEGTVTIAEVTIRNGSAPIGAAVTNDNGDVILDRVAITGNTATMCCGAVANDFGTTVLNRSTVSGNSTPGCCGGGISLNFGTVALTNTTVSGNSVGGCCGGGISNNGGALTLSSSTITGNTAGGCCGGGVQVNGGNPTTTVVTHTIVANNSDDGGEDCSGPITSLGHNIESGSTCGFTQPGDRDNTDPLLGPLASNGGGTRTHAPLPGSPAIDGGSAGGCPPADQRGVPRPLDGDASGAAACDVGAVEVMRFSGALDLALNQSAYAPGDSLTLDVTFASPGPPAFADALAGVFFPAAAAAAAGCPAPGDLAIAFFTAGFAGVEVHCGSAPPSGFPRVGTALPVPGGVPPTVFPGVFQTVVPPGLPPGTWKAFVALTGPSALVDDTVDPGDVLAGDVAEFVSAAASAARRTAPDD